MIRNVFRAAARPRSLACAFGVLSLLGPARARADDPPGRGRDKGDKVAIQVRSIRATRDNNEVSPDLERMAAQLKSSFKYTGYKLLKTADGSAAIGGEFKTPLVEPYTAVVTPQKRTAEAISVKVEVFKRVDGKNKKVTGTTFDIAPGRFQLVGGLKLDSDDDQKGKPKGRDRDKPKPKDKEDAAGDTLIIAVSAK